MFSQTAMSALCQRLCNCFLERAAWKAHGEGTSLSGSRFAWHSKPSHDVVPY